MKKSVKQQVDAIADTAIAGLEFKRLDDLADRITSIMQDPGINSGIRISACIKIINTLYSADRGKTDD